MESAERWKTAVALAELGAEVVEAIVIRVPLDEVGCATVRELAAAAGVRARAFVTTSAFSDGQVVIESMSFHVGKVEVRAQSSRQATAEDAGLRGYRGMGATLAGWQSDRGI